MNNKYSFLLKYGPNEEEVFDIITKLGDKTNANGNRTEIVKRGIHAFQYLMQTDENIFLHLLSLILKELYISFDRDKLLFAKNLSFMIYPIMICKRGRSESELFESVILHLKQIEESTKTQSEVEFNQNIELIRKMLDYMIKSIDFLFLKKDISAEHPTELKVSGIINGLSESDTLKTYVFDGKTWVIIQNDTTG